MYYFNTRTKETTWIRPTVSAVIQEPPPPKFVGVMSGHTNKVTQVVELHDGTLVSSSLDTTLRRWDPDTGSCTQVYLRNASTDGHTQGVNCVIQLKDGRLLSGGGDKTICVWQTDSGVCTHSIGKHPLALVHNDSRAKLLKKKLKPPLVAHNDTDLSYYHTAPITALYECQSVKPGGAHTLATGSADNSVRLWDLGTLAKDKDTAVTSITCLRVLKDHSIVPGELEGRMGHSAAVWRIQELLDGRLASGDWMVSSTCGTSIMSTRMLRSPFSAQDGPTLS